MSFDEVVQSDVTDEQETMTLICRQSKENEDSSKRGGRPIEDTRETNRIGTTAWLSKRNDGVELDKDGWLAIRLG